MCWNHCWKFSWGFRMRESEKKLSNLITIHSEWDSLNLHILPWATSDKLSQFLCFYKSDMLVNYALSVSTPYQWCHFQSQLGRKGSCLISRSPPPHPKNLFHLFGWCFALEISTSSTCPQIWTTRYTGARDKSFLTFGFIICWQGRLLPCDKAFSLYERD